MTKDLLTTTFSHASYPRPPQNPDRKPLVDELGNRIGGFEEDDRDQRVWSVAIKGGGNSGGFGGGGSGGFSGNSNSASGNITSINLLKHSLKIQSTSSATTCINNTKALPNDEKALRGKPQLHRLQFPQSRSWARYWITARYIRT